MGKYKNMADCMAKNRNKKEPGAYCATIMRAMEGEMKKKMKMKKPKR